MLEWDAANICAHRKTSKKVNLKSANFAEGIFCDACGYLRSEIIVFINTMPEKHWNIVV